MLEDFPKLSNGQVALSRADVKTGIVLDERGSCAINPLQKIYNVFDNEKIALTLAETIIMGNANIECYIHNASNLLLYSVTSKEIRKFAPWQYLLAPQASKNSASVHISRRT
jgi:hypothetical protein